MGKCVRVKWIDYAKGITMLLVIIGHTISDDLITVSYTHLMADLSCCLLSSMGIILGTLMIGIFLLLCLVFRRDWKAFLKALACCIPSMVLGVFYILIV